MKRAIPWILYIACVFISRHFARGYWVVGPVFALTCLLIHGGNIRKSVSAKSVVFILFSTITYALVYWIAEHGWHLKQDILDLLIGSMTAGVVLGSFLMPFLHGLTYSVNAHTIRNVSLKLIVSWYLVCLVSFVDNTLNIPWNIDYISIAIALWQGIYLRSLKIHNQD